MTAPPADVRYVPLARARALWPAAVTVAAGAVLAVLFLRVLGIPGVGAALVFVMFAFIFLASRIRGGVQRPPLGRLADGPRRGPAHRWAEGDPLGSGSGRLDRRARKTTGGTRLRRPDTEDVTVLRAGRSWATFLSFRLAAACGAVQAQHRV